MPGRRDEITQAETRMKRHREELAASPVVEVLGVIGPSGVGAARSGGEDQWTMHFTLDAWRVRGDKLQPKALDVHRTVTDKELTRFQNRLDPYSVVRLKVRLGEHPLLGSPDGLLEEVVGVDASDPELNEKAAELQKPVTFDDPTLGTFTLDRRVDWFTAKTTWFGDPVSLSLSATKPNEIQNALKAAHTLWADQATWNQRIRDYAVKKLLSLKNDTWLGDDEVELTPEQFRSRMKPEGITIDPDGSFEFWHNDGDLFWGHSIMVSGDIVKGLNDAGIHG